MISVAIDDWLTPGQIYPQPARIVTSENYQISFDYERQVMILLREGQKEIIPISRIYSILEDD